MPSSACSSSSSATSCTDRGPVAGLQASGRPGGPRRGLRTRRAQRPSRRSSAIAASTPRGVSSGHQASRKSMKASSVVMSSSKEERSSAASSGSVCRPPAPDLRPQGVQQQLAGARAQQVDGGGAAEDVAGGCGPARRPPAPGGGRRRPRAGGWACSARVPAASAPSRRRTRAGRPCALRHARGPGCSSAPRAALRSTFSIRDEPLTRATAGASYVVASRAVDQASRPRGWRPGPPRRARAARPRCRRRAAGSGETIRMPPAYRRRSW